MGDNLTKEKEAVKAAAKNLLNDPTTEVDIVAYGNWYNEYQAWKDDTIIGYTSKNEDELMKKIDDLDIHWNHTGSQRFFQGGLHEAKRILDESTATNKGIVFITDGIPVYSYMPDEIQVDLDKYYKTDYNGNPYLDSYMEIGDDYEIKSMYRDSWHLWGDCDSYTNGTTMQLKGDYAKLADGSSYNGSLFITNIVEKATYFEAEDIRNSGYSLDCVGVGLEKEASQILKNIAKNDENLFMASDYDHLSSTLENIVLEKDADNYYTITDSIGENFVLENVSTPTIGNSTYNEAKNSVEWKLKLKSNETASFSYRIGIDTEKLANLDASLTYAAVSKTVVNNIDEYGPLNVSLIKAEEETEKKISEIEVAGDEDIVLVSATEDLYYLASNSGDIALDTVDNKGNSDVSASDSVQTADRYTKLSALFLALVALSSASLFITVAFKDTKKN